MSRTYRKSRMYNSYTLDSYVKRDLDWFNRRPYKTISVKKTYEEYENDCSKAESEITYDIYGIPRTPYVSRYKVETIPLNVEDVIEESVSEFSEFGRDGREKETSRNRDFKHYSKKLTRNANRILEKKIVSGDENWENFAYPNEKLGDYLVWVYF